MRPGIIRSIHGVNPVLKPIYKLDETTGERQLFIMPEDLLEEKFVLWFSFDQNLPRQRIGEWECMQFPHNNDPEVLQHNVIRAFEDFCRRFKYPRQ